MDNRQNESQSRRPRRPAQTGQQPNPQAYGYSQMPAASRAPSNGAQARATGQAKRTTPPAKRRTTRKKRSQAPDVVYTPAAPFSRGKLLVRLVTVVAVVLALLFGISIFFHVENVEVSGAQKYDEWSIKQASGLKDGDSLFSVNDAQVSSSIITRLPYVKSVRVGIKLPNTVNIYIEELDITYAIRDTSDRWWLISEDGVVVEATDKATAEDRPQILGVKLEKPEPTKQAVPAEIELDVPQETNEDGQTVTQPQTTLASEQFVAAMQILNAMKEQKIIDKIVSVNVSDMGNMQLTYAQQYRVELGNTIDLTYKLSGISQIILQLNQQYSNPVGIIDVSGSINQQFVFTYDDLSAD